MNSQSSESQMRELLRTHQFKKLFTQHLGWDNQSGTQNFTLEAQNFRFEIVAGKGGLPLFVCQVGSLAALSRKTALDLDNLLAKVAAEHIIVFHDAGSQLWQFSKREIGKANRFYRSTQLPNSHSFTDLLGRLDGLKITIEQEIKAQERGGFGVIEIAGRINRNFNVDSVSAKFYTGFKTQRDLLLKFLDGVEGRVKDEYASLLLTRLMFLYFMQAKKFLRGDTGYLRNAFDDKSRRFGSRKDYYAGFLCPLFFEMLSTKAIDRFPKDTAKLREAHRVFGDLIYLNGGLFAARDFEDPKKITVKDEFFDGLFEFFDKWNWVLDDRPTRDGQEINPDVLGYVFEKFINQKQMGAYYTKEDITGYIARNTILPFLFEKAKPNPQRAFGLIHANPQRYIYPAVKHGCEEDLPAEIEAGIADVSKRGGWNKTATPDLGLPTEIWREVVARRTRYFLLVKDAPTLFTQVSDLITHNLNIELWMTDVIANLETEAEVWALWQALEEVSILDPTVGSGAFLFAAMNILEPLYRELLSRMDEVVDDFEDRLTRHPDLLIGHIEDFRATLEDIEKYNNRDYEIFKKMMVGNLYGVDIMSEAVEICKLRLFLKLASQASPEKDQPNLGIEPLPDIDFNIRAGNTLVGFATEGEAEIAAKTQINYGIDWEEVRDGMRDYGHAFDQFHEAQRRDGSVTPKAKATLQSQHDALVEKLNLFNAGQYEQAPKSQKKRYAEWKESHQPFHWCAEFYSILKNDGFDVIIGNPPYIDLKGFSDYKLNGYTTLDTKNLYPTILERCQFLKSLQSRQGYIVPVSSVATEGYKSLQGILKSHDLHASSFDDRPAHLFEGLDKNTVSILIFGSPKHNSSIYTTRLARWNVRERASLFDKLSYEPLASCTLRGCLPKLGIPTETTLWEKLFSGDKPLELFQSKSSGAHIVHHSRKVNAFLQILNFIPEVKDGAGHLRPPSEFKEMRFESADFAAAAFCALNSSLFRWFLDVVSDGSHLNRREVNGFPLDLSRVKDFVPFMVLSKELNSSLKSNSEIRIMKYKHDTLTVQCIIPKKSKPIIDKIDRLLATHYGFTEEELDFIINYDIKYRIGRDAGDE